MTRQINLGAATEQRIMEAFSKRALISTAQAAILLGMDRRGVQRIAASGELGSTLEGEDAAGKERRLFSERHIRAFLEGKSAWAFTDQSDETKKPEPSGRRRSSTSISRLVAGDFTDQLDKLHVGTRKRSNGANARK